MSHDMESPSIGELLQGLQQERRSASNSQCSYRELLRYALQVAAEREVAAEVLAEVRELLEMYAPSW